MPSYGGLYTRIYKFRPLSEEVIALRLGVAEALLIGVLSYRGCEPLCQWRGVAYIEFARTPASPRSKGFNVHKERGLLVTPAIKDHEGHKSYLRDDRL